MLETNNLFREMISRHQEIRWPDDEEVLKLQKVLLSIMDDIDFVCRKNGLTYFLGGGSMLGAVRHGGFIPWDDDMDIVMPRADYDKLEACMRREFPDKYWVQDVRTDDKYDLNNMKIRRKGTEYLELLDPDEEKAGVFIDVYPLEDTYDNPILRTVHGLYGEFLLLICSCVRLKGKKDIVLRYLTDGRGERVVKIKCFIGTLFSFRPLISWLRYTEKVLSRCKKPDSQFVSIPSGRNHYFGEMYHRASFFPAKEVNFQGHKYLLENDPEEYLTKLYGDYRTVPPTEKRCHHGVLKLRVDIEE